MLLNRWTSCGIANWRPSTRAGSSLKVPFRRGCGTRWIIIVTTVVCSTVTGMGRTQTVPQSLVEQFAPQLMHPFDEKNLPANVDWLIDKTHLHFYSGSCTGDNTDFGVATKMLMRDASITSKCGGHVFRASGTRSARRATTFLLTDVEDKYKSGLADPSEWQTYYHAYKNDAEGWTIQYWTFYAFNTGVKVGPVEIGYHGGDWEMVSVVLGPGDVPAYLVSTGHRDMVSTPWTSVKTNGTHPIVYTEKGGHEASINPQGDGPYIVHPTWTGGAAVFPGSAPQPVGPIVDLGTKLHPKLAFVTYSGLWGSLGKTPISSGYWGPVFNETGMGQDGFFRAWCYGIGEPTAAEGAIRECYPDDMQ